ncbi:hypothetical protein [Clostridium tyrobutyricum]|nr:hypothetical protein [Clostridium tyrobutyricum]
MATSGEAEASFTAVYSIFEAHPEFLEEYLPWDPWVKSSCKTDK